jgi:hypothetical protein
MKTVKIILVQSRAPNGDLAYRIAKLIGAVSVHTQSKPNVNWHVGDSLDENCANDLSIGRAYEVTITEKSG